MTKSIVISEHNWDKIREHLFQTQPKSVMLTRWKMRDVLGFTDRVHTEWTGSGDFGPEYSRTIHLDFFDEPKRTMFLLKYSDWINDEQRR